MSYWETPVHEDDPTEALEDEDIWGNITGDAGGTWHLEHDTHAEDHDYSLFSDSKSEVPKSVPQVKTGRAIRTMDGCFLLDAQGNENDMLRICTRAVDNQQHDNHLCEKCRKLDFRRIFSIDPETLPAAGLRVMRLEIRDDTAATSCCPMCRLFASIIDRGEGGKFLRTMDGQFFKKVSTSLPTSYPNGLSGGTNSDGHGLICYLKIVPDTTFAPLYTTIELLDNPVVIALEDEDTSSSTGMLDRCMLIYRSFPKHTESCSCPEHHFEYSIPYEKLSSLIQNCHNNHTQCRVDPLSFPVDAKAIDCLTRTIVMLTPMMQYLALSYVWGKGRTTPNVDVGDKLPSPLPQAIEDTIHVCLKTSVRHLWIDRYCIKQYHSSDKLKQISQMANIYSRALATLCATGADDDANIVGVSTSRLKDHSVEVQGGLLMSQGHDIPLDIRRSIWNERAWTLQEAMLSPMCILFSDSGVIVNCKEETVLEDPTSPSAFRIPRGQVREMLMFGRARDHPSKTPSIITKFELVQAEYLQRQLGYESDSLNAFKAILTQLNTPSYWGITTLWDDSENTEPVGVLARFVADLCWQAGSAGRRRDWKEAPTWSWISRTNQVRKRELPTSSFLGKIFFTANVKVTCLDTRSIPVEDYFRMHSGISVAPEQTKYLQLCSIVAKWKKWEYDQYKQRIELETNDRHTNGLLLNCKADIIFDEGPVYDEFKENELSWRGGSGGNHQYPEQGKAILLMVQVYDTYWVLSRWMAIVELSNGTYERQGMITAICPLWREEDISACVLSFVRDTVVLG